MLNLGRERDNSLPTGYEELTVGAVAVRPTLHVAAGADAAWVQVEGAPIRLRVDGVAPTATSGFFLIDGSEILFSGNELKHLQLIRSDVTSATVRFTYYRRA